MEFLEFHTFVNRLHFEEPTLIERDNKTRHLMEFKLIFLFLI